MDDRHLIIVGGGITGLSAAWEASIHPGWTVTVLEAGPIFGGKLRASEFMGRSIDEGADAFLLRVPHARELCEEIGFTDLVHPAATRASVFLDDTLRLLPTTTVLGVPIDLDDPALANVLSPAGIERARLEPTLAGMPATGDIGAGELVRSRFGDEVADRLVGPLLGGINAGDPDRLSVLAGVPQFAAALAAPNMSAALSRAKASAPDGPVFGAPRTAMASIPTRLAELLSERGVRLVENWPCQGLEPAGGRWRVNGPSDELLADQVIIATPAHVAARLLTPLAAEPAALLADIESSSVALVTLAYDPADAVLDPSISGFLVPREAGLTLTAASWGTSKWPHWLDAEAHPILRVSAGHRNDPGAVELPDDELLSRLGDDLERTMGITAAPVATRVTRWREGFPQYDVGHLDRIALLESMLATAVPGIQVTGAAHRGLGVPACIAQGRAAARAVWQSQKP